MPARPRLTAVKTAPPCNRLETQGLSPHAAPVRQMKSLAVLASPSIAPLSVGALATALDSASTATFLVQAGGRLIYGNRAGFRMLHSGGVLRQKHAHLVTRRAKENDALAAVMLRVAENHQAELLRLLGRDAITRLLITVSPVPEDGIVIVCVVDLQPAGEDLAGWFQQAFQLSPQNADLAEGLLSGLNLSEFSEQNGITLGATQTRLKKLFARTGTKSQAALVSALLRAAAIALPRAQAATRHRLGVAPTCVL
jgi:DNA-binding CsgD family transcriptional regulator